MCFGWSAGSCRGCYFVCFVLLGCWFVVVWSFLSCFFLCVVCGVGWFLFIFVVSLWCSAF